MTDQLGRQGDLFRSSGLGSSSVFSSSSLPLQRQQLLRWQEQLLAHQAPLFGWAAEVSGAALAAGPSQGLLFEAIGNIAIGSTATEQTSRLNPLDLQAQSLTFWRWPNAQQQGAAIYLVMDRPACLASPLLLYVGETGCADRRWKGDHDCKNYLAAYSEALARVAISTNLSIRFWFDVPADIRGRRRFEQALIRRWLPPFNKETREHWATPFTADPN